MTERQLKVNKAYLAWIEKTGGISVGDIRLAAGDRDRAMFANMLVLLREAEGLLQNEEDREEFRASIKTITDNKGTPRSMSVTALRELLVQYGLKYNDIWLAANGVVNSA